MKTFTQDYNQDTASLYATIEVLMEEIYTHVKSDQEIYYNSIMAYRHIPNKNLQTAIDDYNNYAKTYLAYYCDEKEAPDRILDIIGLANAIEKESKLSAEYDKDYTLSNMINEENMYACS